MPLGKAPRRKPADGDRAVGQDSGLMTARYTVRGRNLVGRSCGCVLLHWDVKDVASFKTRWHINSGQAGKKKLQQVVLTASVCLGHQHVLSSC